MFRILQMLRDINTQRVIDWRVDTDESVIIVRIPIDEQDAQLIRDMQALFAPVED